jgi:hypothetical protein
LTRGRWNLGGGVIAAVALGPACGGGPTLPPLPSPVPSASASPPALAGSYVLVVQPDPACGAPGSAFSFAVEAARSDTARYPGVQVWREAPEATLEMELQDLGPMVRGGLGTTDLGAVAAEGIRISIHAIGLGTVTSDRNARAGLSQGTLAGDLAFSHPEDDEGDTLGGCFSFSHRWSLAPR